MLRVVHLYVVSRGEFRQNDGDDDSVRRYHLYMMSLRRGLVFTLYPRAHGNLDLLLSFSRSPQFIPAGRPMATSSSNGTCRK